jgi:hypothetical protein
MKYIVIKIWICKKGILEIIKRKDNIIRIKICRIMIIEIKDSDKAKAHSMIKMMNLHVNKI